MTEILGIDLSAYRPDIRAPELDKLHEAGCRFLGTRISLGDEYIDPTASRYMKQAADRGWVSFGYHFLDRQDEGTAIADGGLQAENYLRALDALKDEGRGAMDGHFLDVEASGLKEAHIVGWVERIRREGIDPSIYSSERIMEKFSLDWEDMFTSEWLADYRGGSRWLNDWETPEEDEEFRPEGEAIWQYGGLKFKTEGEMHNIDGNVYEGTQQQLLDILAGK